MSMNTSLHGWYATTKNWIKLLVDSAGNLYTNLATYLTPERYAESSASISQITDATDKALITFGALSGHCTTYDDGDQAVVSGCSTATGANDTWTVEYVSATTCYLKDSTGAYYDFESDDTGTIAFTHLSRGYAVIGFTQDADGDASVQVTDNELHVRNLGAVGIGVAASSYNADIATSTVSDNVAIPSGARSVWIANESVTTLQSVRFRFGTDASVVATATTGFRVSPGITTAAGDNGPKYLSVPIPDGATHMAYIAESGTPTINVVWGG